MQASQKTAIKEELKQANRLEIKHYLLDENIQVYFFFISSMLVISLFKTDHSIVHLQKLCLQ